MFDLTMINQAVAAFGLGVLVMLVVEVGKRLGAVRDGMAGTWATALNVVLFAGLVLLDVFGVDLEGETMQAIFQLLATLSQLALAVLGAPAAHGALREANVPGFRPRAE